MYTKKRGKKEIYIYIYIYIYTYLDSKIRADAYRKTKLLLKGQPPPGGKKEIDEEAVA